MANYSTIAEVVAVTRHLLDGEIEYNDSTRPTETEVEKFLVRCSAILDTALAGAGFTVPVTQATAKLVCDDWVTSKAAIWVELTQRGVGYSEGEGSRTLSLGNLHSQAHKFIQDNELGFKRLGVPVTYKASDGLQFTAQDAASERDDPDDTSLAQPKFKRGLFDDPEGSGYTLDDDDEDS